MKAKKGNLLLSINNQKFVDGEKIISETFNNSVLKDDIYILHIWSNSVSNISFLIKRVNGQYSAPIIQARGASSTLILFNNGVTIFGNVANIIGLEVYELIFN